MRTNGLSGFRNQRGASTITMLVMVLFFGALLTLIVKVGPFYLDDLTVQEAVESLNDVEDLSRMGPAQVMSLINKRLTVNNVRSLDTDSFKVEKDGELVIIKLNYEKRTNLFRNLDAVVSFNHEYEMKGQ
ncbi:MAG: DUF4845 domain-containing protein [Marinobacter sp.]|uniref:DUF4845 domain-containing protein n=1 Tax=Marinobacter sp. TaxID=50741 RepID=UPI00299E8C00|nr:DUF4845 domain-containing protein [Marinobacter sp.]MDX1754480.1 DUF4845 domain-containing protein [Marinobacter sp.]